MVQPQRRLHYCLQISWVNQEHQADPKMPRKQCVPQNHKIISLELLEAAENLLDSKTTDCSTDRIKGTEKSVL